MHREHGAGSQQTVPPADTRSPSDPSCWGPRAPSQLINYFSQASQAPKAAVILYNILGCLLGHSPFHVVVWDRH